MGYKLQLYSVAASSACERVRIALALKQVKYETIIITDLPPGEFNRINPQGLMPALAIDGHVINQSMAMLEFIEETWPQPALLPEDPVRRAEVRAFCQMVLSDIHPVGTNRMRKKLREGFGLSQADTLEWYGYWAATGFAALEKILSSTRGEGPYCFGAHPTLADLVLIPHMHTAHGLGIDFTGFPSVMAVFDHCVIQPAFVGAARENQQDS